MKGDIPLVPCSGAKATKYTKYTKQGLLRRRDLQRELAMPFVSDRIIASFVELRAYLVVYSPYLDSSV